MDKLLERQNKIKNIIQKVNEAPTEEKASVIVESIQDIVDLSNDELVSRIVNESNKAANDAEYRNTLNLRTLNEKERDFYTQLIKADPKQSVTANQIDIIPETVIDMTLAELHSKSDLLSLVNFGPAGVTKWISASTTGKYAWAKLTDKITEEISGEISVLNYELGKLYTLLILPKAIRELSLEFVDKYFRAVLNMNMNDGLEYGYLDGDGIEKPIGIFRQIDKVDTDGKKKAKTVITDLKGFSPKQLAPIRKILCHNGKRKVSELHLICNPLDEAEYIDPALYGERLGGGYEEKSFVPIVKHVTPNCPQGKAAFTIKGYYTYGVTSVRTDEYKETKALDDADVIISKCYANGRATDNDVAVVFDPTKLEEYIPTYIAIQQSIPVDPSDGN